MGTQSYALVGLLTAALVFGGCSDDDTATDPDAASCEGLASPCFAIQPGAGAQDALLTPLQDPADGTTIALGVGTYNLTTEVLIVGGKNITIRGKGKDKTILSFSGQAAGGGSNGVVADAVDGITFEGFAVEDADGDGLVARKCRNVIMRDIRVEWTNGPDEENGLYAIYPVGSENVLVEDTVAIGASDAGIYVGESRNVIVRNNVASKNVSGLQIENTFDAHVHDNEVYDNSLGLFVFDLPNKDTQKNAGRHLLHDNHSYNNNLKNFGNPNQIAGAVPSGTGFLVMAVDGVEAYNNTIENNGAISIGVVNYDLAQQDYIDPEYDPFPSNVYIHDNKIIGGGDDVYGLIGKGGSPAAIETLTLLADYYDEKPKVADLLYDGLTTDAVNGAPTDNPMFVCFKGNTYQASADATAGVATWDNLHVEKIRDENGALQISNISSDHVESNPTYIDCEGPKQAAVTLDGLE